MRPRLAVVSRNTLLLLLCCCSPAGTTLKLAVILKNENFDGENGARHSNDSTTHVKLNDRATKMRGAHLCAFSVCRARAPSIPANAKRRMYGDV